jgi:two-component system, response regulator YesN
MDWHVVVIDDNPIIVRSIVESVDWRRLHCRVVGEAANGVEGRELIEREQPHLILTDIRMPGLDGLELARIAREEVPRSRVILISAYSDFAYTRKAIKLGVFDYVLKPIDGGQLFEVLQSAIRDLRASAAPDGRGTHGIVSRKELLCEIAAHGMEQEGAPAKLVRALDLTSRFIGVLGFRARSKDHVLFPRLLAAVEKAAVRFRGSVELVYGAVESDHVVFLLHKAVRGRWEARQAIEEAGAYLLERLEPAGREFSFVQGPIAYTLHDLHAAYQSLVGGLDAAFFSASRGKAATRGACADRAALSDIYLHEIDGLAAEIRDGSDDDVIRAAGRFLDRLAAHRGADLFLARSIICELFFVVTRHYLPQARVDSYAGSSVNDIVELVKKFGDIEEAKSHLPAFIERLKRGLAIGGKPLGNLVQNIVAYVESNYAGDLSLARIARQFRVSPAYVSSVFAKETGEPFKDYVVAARLRHAKKLLKDPAYKVYEVSSLVGFKQYEYFFRVFKKHVGVSPLHYRNSPEVPAPAPARTGAG